MSLESKDRLHSAILEHVSPARNEHHQQRQTRRENERQQTYSFPKVNGKGAERARPSGNAVSSRTAYCYTPPPSARTALQGAGIPAQGRRIGGDRKSTRLNSSH